APPPGRCSHWLACLAELRGPRSQGAQAAPL
ncbi:hypothetical protein MC885_012437, partial [Smutsia gigantea]